MQWILLGMMALLAAGFAAGAIALSGLLGPRQPTPEKLAPYECGMPPVGDARERQSVKFYLVAISFLLFDIEVAFVYPWALAARDLRWGGFVMIVIFFAILMVGYLYEWKKGVLDWGKESQPAVSSRQSLMWHMATEPQSHRDTEKNK